MAAPITVVQIHSCLPQCLLSRCRYCKTMYVAGVVRLNARRTLATIESTCQQLPLTLHIGKSWCLSYVLMRTIVPFHVLSVCQLSVCRLHLGLYVMPQPDPDAGMFDVRPRWPLTDRRDPRSMPNKKSMRKSRIFTSLTDLTAEALRLRPYTEAAAVTNHA